MNRINSSKSLIAQCVRKNQNLSLRPMFGNESLLNCELFLHEMFEGDVIFINCQQTDGESVNIIYYSIGLEFN